MGRRIFVDVRSPHEKSEDFCLACRPCRYYVEGALFSVGSLEILKTSLFQTRTDPDALKGVLSWFDGFQSLPIPPEVWLQCQLALIEGFTNAVRHAHRDLARDTPIDIEVTVTTTALDMKIWDRGPGFNFDAMLNRKLETTTPDSEGGRGLKIMSRVADTVTYRPSDDGRNCLHICKQFATSPPETQTGWFSGR